MTQVDTDRMQTCIIALSVTNRSRTEDVYRDMYDRAMSGIKKTLVKQSTFSNPPLLYTAEVVPRFVQGRQGP